MSVFTRTGHVDVDDGDVDDDDDDDDDDSDNGSKVTSGAGFARAAWHFP